MLAWHRLYLRGVPKTYNIRLRVLSYISLYAIYSLSNALYDKLMLPVASLEHASFIGSSYY